MKLWLIIPPGVCRDSFTVCEVVGGVTFTVHGYFQLHLKAAGFEQTGSLQDCSWLFHVQTTTVSIDSS